MLQEGRAGPGPVSHEDGSVHIPQTKAHCWDVQNAPRTRGKEAGFKNPKGLYQTPPGELQAEEGSAELGTFSLLERTNNFQVLSGAPISLRTLVMLMKDPSSLFIRAHLQKTSLQLLCVHVLLYVSVLRVKWGLQKAGLVRLVPPSVFA